MSTSGKSTVLRTTAALAAAVLLLTGCTRTAAPEQLARTVEDGTPVAVLAGLPAPDGFAVTDPTGRSVGGSVDEGGRTVVDVDGVPVEVGRTAEGEEPTDLGEQDVSAAAAWSAPLAADGGDAAQRCAALEEWFATAAAEVGLEPVAVAVPGCAQALRRVATGPGDGLAIISTRGTEPGAGPGAPDGRWLAAVLAGRPTADEAPTVLLALDHSPS